MSRTDPDFNITQPPDIRISAARYLAKRYGITQIPILGLSPEEEPKSGKILEVSKFMKDHHVKTIFFETLVSSKVAEVIAKDVGAKTAVLNPLDGLTEEQMAKNMDYARPSRP